MNAKTTLPPDWKPAAFNPNFNATDEFEEQQYQLDRLRCVLNVLSDLASASGDDCQRATVQLRREDLAGVFLLLRDTVAVTAERNELTHKHVCNLWGWEKMQAERELNNVAAAANERRSDGEENRIRPTMLAQIITAISGQRPILGSDMNRITQRLRDCAEADEDMQPASAAWEAFVTAEGGPAITTCEGFYIKYYPVRGEVVGQTDEA
jgi:hypothetical protein